MDRQNDYVPRRDVEFAEWAEVFLVNIFPSLERFGFPLEVYGRLMELREAYAVAMNIAGNPMTRTKGATKDKNDARRVLETEIRRAVRRYLLPNPRVSSKDREDLRLPIRKERYTPLAVPTSHPKLEIESFDSRQLRLHLRDSDTGNRARPSGVIGALVVYGLLDSPPADITYLLHNRMVTRTPYVFEFLGRERGKMAYFAACWQNRKGKIGPWSGIVCTFVP
jgi:hypothetical protein